MMDRYDNGFWLGVVVSSFSGVLAFAFSKIAGIDGLRGFTMCVIANGLIGLLKLAHAKGGQKNEGE
jgi:uncharacterized membrane protein YjjP (DUF1212 family)